MSRPRENPRKISDKFPPTQFLTVFEPEERFFLNCVDGKFFEIFSWVCPRSTHQSASIELSFVFIGSVGALEVQSLKKKLAMLSILEIIR